jgi:PAS domain S-box-containing protein
LSDTIPAGLSAGLPGASATQDSTPEDLRKALQRYDSLLAAVPAMVYYASSNGIPTWFSSDFFEYTGLPPESLRDWRKVVERVLHPEDVSRLAEAQLMSIKEATPFEAEIRLRSKLGGYRWFLNRAVPVRSASGDVVEWIGTTMDIHERKVMEDELRRSNQLKDEFLGFVSHELRTPLTSIFGSARILQSRSEHLDESEKRELLDTVVEESERVKEIIDELLTLARTEVISAVRKSPVDVRGLIEALAAESKMNEQRVAFLSDDCTVYAEPVIMRQVLANLVSNAAKYSPAGSTLEVLVEQKADRYVIEVADRGPGVPPEDLDRIFEPFYRSDVSSRGSKGSGLGLAVSRRLVEAQGGRISAHGRPGGGLLVRIDLPRERRRLRDDRESV